MLLFAVGVLFWSVVSLGGAMFDEGDVCLVCWASDGSGTMAGVGFGVEGFISMGALGTGSACVCSAG